jgi:hypothetical protein
VKAHRWLFALAVFQLLIAALLGLNWNGTVDAFTGRSFAPDRNAAEGAALGSLGVHVLLAALFVVVAAKLPARWARVLATVLLVFTIVVGVAILFPITRETALNPVGIIMAVVALVLLWVPARTHATTR